MIAASVVPWPIGIWVLAIAVIALVCWSLGGEGGLAKDPGPPARARREIDALKLLRDDEG